MRKTKAVKNPVKKAPKKALPLIKNKNKLKQIININVGGKTPVRRRPGRKGAGGGGPPQPPPPPPPPQHTFMSSVPMDFQQNQQRNILQLLRAQNKSAADVEAQAEYHTKLQEEQDKLTQAMNEGSNNNEPTTASAPTPEPTQKSHAKKRAVVSEIAQAAERHNAIARGNKKIIRKKLVDVIKRAAEGRHKQEAERHHMQQEDVKHNLKTQQAETLKAIKKGAGAGRKSTLTYDEAVNNLKAMTSEQQNKFLVNNKYGTLPKYARALGMTPQNIAADGKFRRVPPDQLRASIIANLPKTPTKAQVNKEEEYITVTGSKSKSRKR